MPPLAAPALHDRATPYAMPKDPVLAGADSVVAAKVAAAGELEPQAGWSLSLSAGRLAMADGSGAGWSAPDAAAHVRAITSAADAPPGVGAAVSSVLVDLGAAAIPTSASVPAAARAAISTRGLDSTFFVYDLGALHRAFAAWAAAFPGVTPHFAVKSNPDPGLLRLLASLGAGFDCASRAEISLVLGAAAVEPARIIYAHPCKPPSEVRYACSKGVSLTTFDTEGEVAKLARWYPACRALLRIRADDPTAKFCLGSKYGCEVEAAPGLLAAAKRAGVAVVGVAFHVGSGARDPAAFGRAIEAAAGVFEAGRAAGHEMALLDLGGGFPGADPALPDAGLGAIAAATKAALAANFPAGRGIRVIAEPGRFFAEPVGTLAVAVNGVRPRAAAAPAGGPAAGAARDAVDYFLSDGVYGCLNSIIYDDARLAFAPLRLEEGGGEGEGDAAATGPLLLPSTLYGPTCDSADIVARGVRLPRLAVGDFLLVPRASAYSIAGASNFNGFQAAKAGAVYVYSLRA